MNWTTTSMDLEDNQTKTKSIDLNEFTVRGGKFPYKSIKPITSTILIATIFFLYLFDPPFSGVSTLIYTSSLPSSFLYMWTVDSFTLTLVPSTSFRSLWGWL